MHPSDSREGLGRGASDRRWDVREYGEPFQSRAGYGDGFGPQGLGMEYEPGGGGMAGPYSAAEVARRLQGKGPRSYRRSDERIREEVCDRLMQGWMNAADVDVQVERGEVTLRGEVDSLDEKRAIEDFALSVFGVHDVHNELRLRRERPDRPGQE